VILYIVPELAWELQLTIFAVLSVVTVLISRKYLQKNGEDQSTLSQRGKRYIGMTVVVEEPIENDIGKVRIEDTLWRAAGQDAPKGNKVRIIGIDGATFQVERVSAE
jgi:membrane protein implicated in regulation of membrane protease activity